MQIHSKIGTNTSTFTHMDKTRHHGQEDRKTHTDTISSACVFMPEGPDSFLRVIPRVRSPTTLHTHLTDSSRLTQPEEQQDKQRRGKKTHAGKFLLSTYGFVCVWVVDSVWSPGWLLEHWDVCVGMFVDATVCNSKKLPSSRRQDFFSSTIYLCSRDLH